MPEVTVTLNEVESKDVNTKRGLSTVYRLKGSDGRTYTTFDHELAKQAAQFRGHAVIFGYQESKNGEWTNYNLDSVKVAPADDFVGSGVLLPAAAPYSPSPATKTQEDRDVSIARAVALKAAVETTGPDDPKSILEVAGVYVDWLLTGVVEPAADVVPF